MAINAKYVPASHQAGNEDHESHTANVAAMFGGSAHTTANGPVVPVQRNFMSTAKRAELASKAHAKAAPPPPPPSKQGATHHVEPNLSVGGWHAKHGGPTNVVPTIRRRGSIEDLGSMSAVSGGGGFRRASPPAGEYMTVEPAAPVAVRKASNPNDHFQAAAYSSRKISFVKQRKPSVEQAAPPAPAPAPQEPKQSTNVHPLAMQRSQTVGHIDKPASVQKKPFSATKSIKFGGAPVGNVCPVCSRSVFKMEEVQIEGNFFHKWCCRCSIQDCNKRLVAGNYASYQGAFFCKPCFMKCFKQAGNYDEGFGHKQHKLNWVSPTKGESLEGEDDV